MQMLWNVCCTFFIGLQGTAAAAAAVSRIEHTRILYQFSNCKFSSAGTLSHSLIYPINTEYTCTKFLLHTFDWISKLELKFMCRAATTATKKRETSSPFEKCSLCLLHYGEVTSNMSTTAILLSLHMGWGWWWWSRNRKSPALFTMSFVRFSISPHQRNFRKTTTTTVIALLLQHVP